MNGILRPDLANMLMIGGVAFLFIFAANRALRAVGKPTWTTSGA